MPDRSLKMKRRIFGFQRRVWWPKWTPASSRSRMEATAIGDSSFGFRIVERRRGSGAPASEAGTRAATEVAGWWDRDAKSLAADRKRLARGGPPGPPPREADVVAPARYVPEDGGAGAVRAAGAGLRPSARPQAEEEDRAARERRAGTKRRRDGAPSPADPQVGHDADRPLRGCVSVEHLVAGRHLRRDRQAPAPSGRREAGDLLRTIGSARLRGNGHLAGRRAAARAGEDGARPVAERRVGVDRDAPGGRDDEGAAARHAVGIPGDDEVVGAGDRVEAEELARADRRARAAHRRRDRERLCKMVHEDDLLPRPEREDARRDVAVDHLDARAGIPVAADGLVRRGRRCEDRAGAVRGRLPVGEGGENGRGRLRAPRDA